MYLFWENEEDANPFNLHDQVFMDNNSNLLEVDGLFQKQNLLNSILPNEEEKDRAFDHRSKPSEENSMKTIKLKEQAKKRAKRMRERK